MIGTYAMKLPPLEYACPATLSEAVALLRRKTATRRRSPADRA